MKTMKKRKPSQSVEHRITKLEDGMKSMDGKLDEIKTYVSNHLVHALEQTNADLKTLLDRKSTSDAVRNFLNNTLKFSMSLATIVWVILQIFTHYYPVKEGIARLLLN